MKLSVNWSLVRQVYWVLFFRALPITTAALLCAVIWVCVDAGRWPDGRDLELLGRLVLVKAVLYAVLSAGIFAAWMAASFVGVIFSAFSAGALRTGLPRRDSCPARPS